MNMNTHETLLRPLQKFKLCATIFHDISNYVTALWVCAPSCCAMTTIRDYVFLYFYCHTIALMSTATHYETLLQIETRSPSCVKLSSNRYNGNPHTSQSLPPSVFSKVQCGHTRPPADVWPSPRAGVATLSNSSGGMSSSRIRVDGASGAGRAGR